jgi:alpha-L-arabinofuranosidase
MTRRDALALLPTVAVDADQDSIVIDPARRPLMRNYVWGGRETNPAGTGEFVSFCRRTGAEPLMFVRFLGDRQRRCREARVSYASAW